jgi:hypothetical protein
MAQVASSLVPVTMLVKGERELSSAEIERANAGAFVRFPNEWRAVDGRSSTVVLGFADVADIDVLPGTILYGDDAATVPIRDTTDIPVVNLRLTRGIATFFVEISTLATSLARVWADLTLEAGDLVAVPLGRGGAGGAAAVIDAGDRLIRAVYDDGQHRPDASGNLTANSVATDKARMASATEIAREMMFELQ